MPTRCVCRYELVRKKGFVLRLLALPKAKTNKGLRVPPCGMRAAAVHSPQHIGVTLFKQYKRIHKSVDISSHGASVRVMKKTKNKI